MAIGEKRVWILECHRAGDHAQCVGLAHALGWPFEVKHIAYTWYELLPNMLIESGLLRIDASLFGTDAGLLGIDREKSSEFTPPWPDLVISAGRRNEVAAKWIGQKSGGRTKVVLVGRTWTNPGKADLVIATPQYRLPSHPNQLINDLPMHIVDESAQAQGAALWGPRWAGLPRPWIAVFVGGTSGPYIFDTATGDRLAREVAAVARETGGSLLVTTSARTPKSILSSLKASASDVPIYVHEWQRGQAENPYPALLALADRFVVTGDSMSMLAEAASTQKPLQIFEFGSGLVPMRGPWSTSQRMRLSDWLRQRPSTLVNALFISLPPFKLNRSRDIRIMQDILLRSGRAVWLGEDMKRWRPSPTTDLERAVKRVRALFKAEDSARLLLSAATAPRESVDQMPFSEPVQPARKARTRVG